MALFGFVPFSFFSFFFLIKQCKMPVDIFHLMVKLFFFLKEQPRTQKNTELEDKKGHIMQ